GGVGQGRRGGPSHSRGPAETLSAEQLARTVPGVHQRTALHPKPAPGTGSDLITPPPLLISSRPRNEPAASSAPAGWEATPPRSVTVASVFCSRPARLYRCSLILLFRLVAVPFSARMVSPPGLA